MTWKLMNVCNLSRRRRNRKSAEERVLYLCHFDNKNSQRYTNPIISFCLQRGVSVHKGAASGVFVGWQYQGLKRPFEKEPGACSSQVSSPWLHSLLARPSWSLMATPIGFFLHFNKFKCLMRSLWTALLQNCRALGLYKPIGKLVEGKPAIDCRTLSSLNSQKIVAYRLVVVKQHGRTKRTPSDVRFADVCLEAHCFALLESE